MPNLVMAGPVKRSVTIAGHQTSISLEPLFWSSLHDRAALLGLPVNALVARIDCERLEADEPPNLASAIRLWLFAQNQSAALAQAESGDGVR